MDLKLNTSGDLDTTNNKFSVVDGYDAINQNLKVRFRTFLGEWFLDTSIGMPWFQEFLVKNPNKLIMDARIRACILGTPGIIALQSINYDFNPSTRNMAISFVAKLQSGTNFTFVYEPFVIGG